MPRRFRRATRGCLLMALGLALLGLGHTVASAADPALLRLEVTIGKSQVLNLQEPFARVSVTNPAIADVFVVTPSQILINGKTIFFDVLVQTDLALLRERLKQVAPRDDIQVHAAQDALILDGNVSSERTTAGAIEVAGVFAPKGKVISLMSLI